MRSLDDFLPVYEFSERHRLEIRAERARVDRALRSVSVDDVPGMRALFLLRGLGRTGRDTSRPFLGLARLGAVALEDVGGKGVVFGLTGQFWRLRGGQDSGGRVRRRSSSHTTAPTPARPWSTSASPSSTTGTAGSRPRRVYTSRTRLRGGPSAATGS